MEYGKLKGSTRITKSNPWLHTGPPRIQTRNLRTLSTCSLNSGTWGCDRYPGQSVRYPPPSGEEFPNPKRDFPLTQEQGGLDEDSWCLFCTRSPAAPQNPGASGEQSAWLPPNPPSGIVETTAVRAYFTVKPRASSSSLKMYADLLHAIKLAWACRGMGAAQANW